MTQFPHKAIANNPFTNNPAQDWLGLWRFTRSIAHADGARYLVDGTASLSLARKGAQFPVTYFENGVLRRNQQEFVAERRYYWNPKSNSVEVYFDDGRFFHEFFWHKPEATHFCTPDHYAVKYQFAQNEWQSRWHVQGPKKDYVMTSHYIALANG